MQSWLDSVAEKDPAEAFRLWLALLRYVTPTLQAAAIADVSPKSTRDRLTSMTNEELMELIVNSPEAAELVTQGVETKQELLVGLIKGSRGNAFAGPAAQARQVPRMLPFIPEDDELLR